jgi:hypothetical protein
MANRAAAITQNDAKRLFKAARQAGWDSVKITVHPDGRLDAAASFAETAGNPETENSWDAAMRKSRGSIVLK